MIDSHSQDQNPQLILKSSSDSQSSQQNIEFEEEANEEMEELLLEVNELTKKNYQIIKVIYRSELSEILLLSHECSEGAIRKVMKIGPGCRKQGQILEQIRHRNIVNIEKVSPKCLIMNYYDGNVSKLIKKYEIHGVPTHLILCFLQSIASALKQVHRSQYIHGDIKPHNILYSFRNGNYSFYLSDFGNSTKFSQAFTKPTQTLAYRAPQIVFQELNHKRDASKIDIWGLGCILFEFLTGRPLFLELEQAQQEQISLMEIQEMYQRVKKIQLQNALNRYSIPSKNEQFQQILCCCLEIDPQSRPTPDQILTFVSKIKG